MIGFFEHEQNMITVEELLVVLKRRVIYDENTMVCWSRGRASFVLCPINNRKPLSDVFVITKKSQNAKWKHICTIQNMLKRARIHDIDLMRVCVFCNSKGFQIIEDRNDGILHVGKEFQNALAIKQILDDYYQ